jgi:hypothetical protein
MKRVFLEDSTDIVMSSKEKSPQSRSNESKCSVLIEVWAGP